MTVTRGSIMSKRRSRCPDMQGPSRESFSLARCNRVLEPVSNRAHAPYVNFARLRTPGGERSERVSGKLLSNLFQPPQQDKVCPHPGRSEALSSFSNSGDVGNGMVGQF